MFFGSKPLREPMTMLLNRLFSTVQRIQNCYIFHLDTIYTTLYDHTVVFDDHYLAAIVQRNEDWLGMEDLDIIKNEIVDYFISDDLLQQFRDIIYPKNINVSSGSNTSNDFHINFSGNIADYVLRQLRIDCNYSSMFEYCTRERVIDAPHQSLLDFIMFRIYEQNIGDYEGAMMMSNIVMDENPHMYNQQDLMIIEDNIRRVQQFEDQLIDCLEKQQAIINEIGQRTAFRPYENFYKETNDGTELAETKLINLMNYRIAEYDKQHAYDEQQF